MVNYNLTEIIGGKGAVEASQVAATTAWIIPSEHYRARAIRSYAKEYLRLVKFHIISRENI